MTFAMTQIFAVQAFVRDVFHASTVIDFFTLTKALDVIHTVIFRVFSSQTLMKLGHVTPFRNVIHTISL